VRWLTSPTSRRTDRGSAPAGGSAGSVVRQPSIHGNCHSRGTPPPTSRAKSCSGLGRRPGASATTSIPISSTWGTRPDAHCRAADCAERRPCACDRATSNTGAGAAARSMGQPCRAAAQPGSSEATVDSPAPPWVPSTQSCAGRGWDRVGSRSPTSGAATSGCGSVGPVAGGNARLGRTLSADGRPAGRDTQRLGSSDIGVTSPRNGSRIGSSARRHGDEGPSSGRTPKSVDNCRLWITRRAGRRKPR
jgi:hypothetical protein